MIWKFDLHEHSVLAENVKLQGSAFAELGLVLDSCLAAQGLRLEGSGF